MNNEPSHNHTPLQQSMLVGVLSTTAVILLVGLIIVQSRPAPVFAEGMTIMKDDFVLTVGAATRNDEELIYIIDAPEQKMNVYRFEQGRKQIDLVQSVPLKEMREQAATGAKAPPPRKK